MAKKVTKKKYRSPDEMAQDDLFLAEMVRVHGRDLPVEEATRLINAHRQKTVERHASASGLSRQETDVLIANSQLSARRVGQQLRRLRDRAQAAATLGMAGVLDQQLAQIQQDLDATDRLIASLDVDMEGFRSNAPDLLSAGYRELDRILARREELRREFRTVCFGQQMATATQNAASLAQALSDTDSPDAAKDFVERAMTDTLNSVLAAASASYHGPEATRVIRELTATAAAQVRLCKEVQGANKNSAAVNFQVIEITANEG